MPEISGGMFNMQAKLENLQSRINEINQAEAMRCRAQLLGKPNEKIGAPKTPQQVWEFQVEEMIHAGFHTKLGMSKEQYRNSLPSLPELDPSITKNFPTPVLVDTRIPISNQIKGFDDDITEHGESPDGIKNATSISHLQDPYIIWTNDGSKYANLSLAELNKQLQKHERPLTFLELLALQRANVELFFHNRPTYTNDGFSISSGSSVTQKGNIPTIYHNYFPLKETGEFQADAFSDVSVNYPHRPTAGWPTGWQE
jgi:hypothetical protein